MIDIIGSDKNWDWKIISKHNNITKEIIMENIDPWTWVKRETNSEPQWLSKSYIDTIDEILNYNDDSVNENLQFMNAEYWIWTTRLPDNMNKPYRNNFLIMK